MDESKKKDRYEDAKKFVRYSDGAKMYSMGMTKFQEVAKDANRYMEANKPCNSGSFIRQYMQFLSHSRRFHSRRGKNSILLLFLKYKI